MGKYQTKKVFSKYDIIIYIAIIIIAILALSIAFEDKGETVKIYVDGELLYTESLNKTKIIELEGKGIVKIDNGKVSFYDSTCPDHLCEKQGQIAKVGEKIVCLPNKIVIEISGESEFEAIV